MDLNKLTVNQIERGVVPFKELLQDSLYYPASELDGLPIKNCCTIWRDLGINSFVYCDFNVKESDLLHEAYHLCGYKILANRHLDPSEYIPQGWELEMVDRNRKGADGRPVYFDTFLGGEGPKKYAQWIVFERTQHKNETHGPKRISLLFICGEGLATFQQLYCHNRVAPKMLCFIQCWGFAGNWTNFTGFRAPFHRTLLKHNECIPEWLCIGHHDYICGVQRISNTSNLGIRLLGYETENMLERHFGDILIFNVNDEARFSLFTKGNRRYAALSAAGKMHFVVYDVTNCNLGDKSLLKYLLM